MTFGDFCMLQPSMLGRNMPGCNMLDRNMQPIEFHQQFYILP